MGGGSGGHVTPVLAVINELNTLDPKLKVSFVCDKAFESQSRGLMEHAAVKVKIYTVTAGKLRRYHGIPFWKQLLDLPTVFKNIRDVFKVVAGSIQSYLLLSRLNPDVVFAKGGYVCLPVGIAARIKGIPLVIHDSDTRPGLTNKILSRWAARIGTGAPLQNYSYPKEISKYVGVPIRDEFHPFDEQEQRAAKEMLGVSDLDKPLVVVTGGGLGAKSINDCVVEVAPDLLKSGIAIYHITGKRQFKALEAKAPKHADYQLVPFIYKDMAKVLGAGDIVIARGSATFLQELAALQKAVVVIPAEHLSDQVKNAQVFEEAEAALVLSDTTITKRPSALLDAVNTFVNEPAEAHHAAAQLHTFARPHAAADVAALVVEAVADKKKPVGTNGAVS